MDITREYFTKIEFVNAVEKLKEFQELDHKVIKTAENLKPRINELKEMFENFRVTGSL